MPYCSLTTFSSQSVASTSYTAPMAVRVTDVAAGMVVLMSSSSGPQFCAPAGDSRR